MLYPSWKTQRSRRSLTPVPSSVRAVPQFNPDQQVYFAGGIGTIKSCCLDSGIWTYAIEMPLGPKPAIGRLGSETTILLSEPELQAVERR